MRVATVRQAHRRGFALIPGACIGLLSWLPTANGFAACSVEKYAELPVTMNGRYPEVEGSVNGVPATFIADSGAFYSVLWADRAARFKLHLERAPGGMQLQGIGGKEDARVATLRDFSLRGLGGSVFHKVQFLVAGQAPGSEDGVIGQNILSRADSEYDLANGVIRLFRSTGCEGYSLAYWRGTAPLSEMPIRLTTDLEPHIIGSAKLNGIEVSVLFDTGSTHSLLRLKAAVRAGFDPSRAAGNYSARISPIGPGESEVWLARFDDLDLGGEEIKNVRLRVADSVMPADADLTLGADFFLSHRIYIAPALRKIYFTYNGGRIFDLSDTGGEPATAGGTEAPASTAASESPLDAAQYLRRAAASAARGEYSRAIADFDAAIRLKPDDAESYYRRGNAKFRARQLTGAAEDFDQALKLQPHNAQWLIGRGALRVIMSNEAGASADFDAAVRLSPETDNLDLDIADIYEGNGRYEAAIGRIDRWADAHPRDSALADALNTRCWYRAESGKELDKALADCNAALKLKPNFAEAFDSRALVQLRLGNYDKSVADYQAALRREPRQATSLYGLGLAQLRSGRQAEGSQRMQEALAIDSETAERFRRIGLSP
jgi:tetratricopeptide (TPR) repeat protein